MRSRGQAFARAPAHGRIFVALALSSCLMAGCKTCRTGSPVDWEGGRTTFERLYDVLFPSLESGGPGARDPRELLAAHDEALRSGDANRKARAIGDLIISAGRRRRYESVLRLAEEGRNAQPLITDEWVARRLRLILVGHHVSGACLALGRFEKALEVLDAQSKELRAYHHLMVWPLESELQNELTRQECHRLLGDESGGQERLAELDRIVRSFFDAADVLSPKTDRVTKTVTLLIPQLWLSHLFIRLEEQQQRRAKEEAVARRLNVPLAQACLALGRWQAAYDLMAQVKSRDRLSRFGWYVYGRSCLHLNKRSEAESAIELVARTKFWPGDTSPPVSHWEALLALAEVKEALGKLGEAGDCYFDCIDAVGRVRQSVVSDRYKLSLARRYQGPFECAIDFFMRQRRHRDALEVAELAKSRALVDLLAGKALGRTSRAAAIAQEWRRSLDRAQLLALATDASPDDLRAATRSASSQHEQLKGLDTELCSFVAGAAVTPDEIQQLVPSGATLVEYFQTEKATYAWAVDRHSVVGYTIPVGRTQLSAQVGQYRRALMEALNRARGPGGIARADSGGAVAHRSSEGRLAGRLYELLVAPLDHAIGGRLVYFVPHGPLHYLPLHALCDGRRRIIEKWAVAYLPSATVLKWVARRDEGSQSPKILALYDPWIGDPRYRLAFAESEVLAIAASWPGVERRTGREASESFLVREAEQFDVIHLACHGEFDTKNPLRSGLLLAPGEGNDGRLTAEEIYRLQLKARLVVLSACETGLGELTQGDDVVGLTRGLLYAGTPAVVDSLWKVEDQATCFTMGRFYSNLHTLPKAEALRQAQLAAMREYPEPAFWAAFRLIGDAGRL